MQTISGTRAWCASTTAGCSSAAAVPLVTQMTVGFPVAIASPSAKNAPLRSSRRTWTRRRSASGSARGVERDPAQMTASVTPTADPLVDQGGAEGGLYAHPTCHSMSRSAVRARRWCSCTASPRRGDSGALSATCWLASRIVVRRSSGPRRLGGRCGQTCRRRRAWWRMRCGRTLAMNRATCSATPSGHGWRCTMALADGLPLGHIVFIGVTAGIEDDDDAGRRRRPTKRWRITGGLGRRRRIHRQLAERTDVQRLDRDGAATVRSDSATVRRAWRPACGSAARAPRMPSWDQLGRLAAPSSPWPGTDDTRFAAPRAAGGPTRPTRRATR